MILHTRWNISEKPAPVKEVVVKKEAPKKKKSAAPKASKPAVVVKPIEDPTVEEFLAELSKDNDEVKKIIEE